LQHLTGQVSGNIFEKFYLYSTVVVGCKPVATWKSVSEFSSQ